MNFSVSKSCNKFYGSLSDPKKSRETITNNILQIKIFEIKENCIDWDLNWTLNLIIWKDLEYNETTSYNT